MKRIVSLLLATALLLGLIVIPAQAEDGYKSITVAIPSDPSFTIDAIGDSNGLTINLVRICLSGLLFSGLFAMLYSLAGGLISLAVMWALKRTGLFSMAGVSMAGGVAHNFGQVVVAAVIVENIRMFAYFPGLLFTGLAAGILMGIVAYIIDRSLPKQLFN